MNNNFNKKLATEKNLIINGSTEPYLKIENLYKRLFEKFLTSKVDLKAYDEKIKNSELYFGKPNPTKEQLLNGLNEYLDLDYIYLLNNFFIEKLDIKDIDAFKNESSENELTEIIGRTYKEIIKDNYNNENDSYSDEVCYSCYGTAVPSNFASNNSLVLKIFYSLNTKTYSDEEFIQNIKDKREFLEKLCDEIKREVKEKLDIDCTILIDKIPN